MKGSKSLPTCVASLLSGYRKDYGFIQLIELSPLWASTAIEPGHALNISYANKWRSYGEACDREGMSFVLLPFDTMGAMHPITVQQLTKLGQALARAHGSDENESVRHLFQRVSILLIKSNASIITNRVPDFPDETAVNVVI